MNQSPRADQNPRRSLVVFELQGRPIKLPNAFAHGEYLTWIPALLLLASCFLYMVGDLFAEDARRVVTLVVEMLGMENATVGQRRRSTMAM